MNHGRSIWLAALVALLVLGLVLGSACGDDDGGDQDSGTDRGGESGSGGDDDDKDAGGGASGSGSGDKDAGGGESGSGGSDGGGAPDEGGSGGNDALVDAGMVDSGGIEVCGSEVCAQPMCCADAFASSCGLQINARACLPPQPTSTMTDERCPSVSVMSGAFMIPSCCTEEGRCGINAQAAGMGCIALEEVIAFSSSDAGGGMGFGIMWPEPKACD